MAPSARKNTLSSRRSSEIARKRGIRSSAATCVSCTITCPSAVSVTLNGSSCSEGSAPAEVRGNSIGTPTVSMGAATMKMISNTSMTSTNGVTLISDMRAPARWRRRRAPEPPCRLVSCAPISAVQIARQKGAELIGELLESAGDLVAVIGKLVVEDGRRNGGQKAQTRGQKRLGDTGRHDGKVGRLRQRDFLERVLDPPDRAEKPDERAGRTDRGQERQPLIEVARLAVDGHIHRAVDALRGTGDQRAVLAVRPLPFGHAGGEHPFGRARRRGAEAGVKLIERLARPEGSVETGGLRARAPKDDVLLNDDRPGPERGDDQNDHYQFDRGCCACEKRQKRKINIARGGESRRI